MPAGSLSPMMQQYHEAKRAAGDALLLFRMGDFYELFFDDAKTAARVLGLALTSRDKGDDPVPMAGFPYHQLDSYLAKIIAAGHRAAICEQVEDPKLAKGLVKREVTRIVTPGTLTDDALLDPQASNFLAAIVLPAGGQVATPLARASRGSMFRRAGFMRRRFRPSRLPISWPGFSRPSCSSATMRRPLPRDWTNGVAITRRPAWTFGRTAAIEALTKHFGTQSLEGFGFDAEADADDAAGAAGGRRGAQLSGGNAKGVARAHRSADAVFERRAAGDRSGHAAQPGDCGHDSRRAARRVRCWARSIAR